MTSRVVEKVDYANKHHFRKEVMLSALGKVFGLVLLIGVALALGLIYDRIKTTGLGANPNMQAVDFSVPKPIRIKIPAIKVDAATEELTLNRDGTLEVPKNPQQVGWYINGPRPGGVGPAVMVGHLDSAQGPEVFWNLKNLKVGDTITITREDNSVVTFRVTDKQSYSQNNFPTDKVYGSISYPGLRLITCSGTYSRLVGHYSDNLVVYATLVK